MNTQMLGLMSYITSIMRWQSIGRRTAGMAAGNVSAPVSFEERLRQSVQKEVSAAALNRQGDRTSTGEPQQKSSDPMEIMQIINPCQSLAMLGYLNLFNN